MSTTGDYQFPVPSGDYTLYAYGSNLRKKEVPITVPAGQSEYHPAPVELAASGLELMKGHPAPEFVGVVGWKGTPVKLADLRGKIVLVDFWGYWCGPCVGSMPVLMDLHEKYKDKGVAILSVHVDIDGDVDSAAKLDEKTAEYRQKLWNGRDLPFPAALSAGKETPDGYDGITAAQYGILDYPTTVLIDRQGNIVDEFEARDTAAASAEIDRLLASGK
jgi:thiol-disulfide isomerase/thioredoxin